MEEEGGRRKKGGMREEEGGWREEGGVLHQEGRKGEGEG